MAIDFKTISADTTFGSGAFLFGADSQSASEPSLYSESTVFGYLLGLANTWTNNQTINTGEKTASAPILDMTQTWNNGAVTFTGIKANITDTSSASGSLLMDLQVGGSSKLRVDKTGALVNTLNTFGESNFTLRGGSSQNTGINIQGSSIYFQSSTAVGAVISISGSAGNISSSSTGLFGFHLSTPGFDAVDTMLTRKAAASLRLGAADAASPVAQTFGVQSVVAGTTNTAGANFTIAGSQGTGSGAGGSIIFQVAPAGSSGTAQNALATAYTISTSGTQIVHTFTGNLNISAGASIGNGANLFAIGSGNVYAANAALTLGTAIVPFTSLFVNTQVAWSSGGTVDVILARDAANTLALRNSTNAQTFRVYNTYTDASNYERGFVKWGTNVLKIGTEKAGTGTARALEFQTDGTTRLTISSTGAVSLSGADFTTPAGGTWSQPSAVELVAGGHIRWAGRSRIYSDADGDLTFYNYAVGDFGLLQFGGTTSSYPALKRSTTSLQVRLADDSGYTNIQGKLTTETAYTAGAPTATGYIVLYDSTGTAYKVPAEAL